MAMKKNIAKISAEEFVGKLDADFQAMMAKEETSVKYFTDEQVEFFYSIAYDYWTVGQYEKALDAFMVVLSFRKKNIKYIEALARCYADLKQYMSAASMYSYSILCGGSPEDNLLRMAQCYVYCDLVDEAMAVLLSIFQIRDKKKGQAGSVMKAVSLMNLLSSKKKLSSGSASYAIH